jgi:hypothetical protein
MTVIQESPHVSPRQVARWVLQLWRAGVRQASGLMLDVRPHASPLGTTMAVSVILADAGREIVVMAGLCRDDLTGPLQINLYQPGLWTADLHREAILNYDNEEE